VCKGRVGVGEMSTPNLKKKCTYADCERPEESRIFSQIWEGSTSGGQNWSSLTGSVLCTACYQNFWLSGTLERSKKKPLVAASATRCTYAGCERPEESSRFTQVREGITAGGQDWSSLAGSVLCHTCYAKFMRKGTLEKSRHKSGTIEKSHNKPLAASTMRCTYADCERPADSSKFYQISEDSTSGGQDWSSLAGSVLCQACYLCFNKSGTLERYANKPLAAEGGGRAGKRKAACEDDKMRGKGEQVERRKLNASTDKDWRGQDCWKLVLEDHDMRGTGEEQEKKKFDVWVDKDWWGEDWWKLVLDGYFYYGFTSASGKNHAQRMAKKEKPAIADDDDEVPLLRLFSVHRGGR
jgi:hypothetical protein